MFEVKDLGFFYGGANHIKALDGISFNINKGAFTAIAGPVGSGKTTLALLLSGLVEPTSGIIIFDGKILGKEIKQHQIWQKIGIVLQQPESQIFESTVFDEVAYALKNAKFKSDEIKEKVKKATRLVGLSESYLDRSPFKLSGGEKRQVALASIIAYEPEILIFDEPTAGLDRRAKEAFLSFLSIVKNKCTIILISHDAEELILADEIILLNKSKLVARGEINKIINQHFSILNLSIPKKWQFLRDISGTINKRLDENIDSDNFIRDLEDNYGLS